MTLSFSSTTAAQSPLAPSSERTGLEALQPAGACAVEGRAQSYKRVQPLSPAEVSTLSDEALEAHIVACGAQMLEADRRYRETSCLSDAGERDRFWMAERIALVERNRRPHIVAAMEAARGLGPRAVEVQEQ